MIFSVKWLDYLIEKWRYKNDKTIRQNDGWLSFYEIKMIILSELIRGVSVDYAY